jgi:hypothetical protein
MLLLYDEPITTFTSLDARGRFQLNVTAGSQKRAIHECKESEGRDESRFVLKMKRNLDLNCKSRSLSIFCHYWDKHCHYWDNQNIWAFSRCVENDSSAASALDEICTELRKYEQ